MVVAVFFGSRSAEHDVGIVTALSSIIKPLESINKYIIIPIYIAKNGAFYCSDKFKKIEFFQQKNYEDFLDAKMLVNFRVSPHGLEILNKSKYKTNRLKIDVAFPAIHGTFGEDGSLMGLLRMTNTPYVGCDMESSVLSMNKALSKKICQNAGIECGEYVALSKTAPESYSSNSLQKIINKLSLPLFVKPVHLGSSIGITKVNSIKDLINAVEVAFYFDNEVIIERAIQNLIEVTVPILGITPNEIIAKVERPLFNGDEFFDFETKYLSGGGKKSNNGGKKSGGSQGYSEIPAKLDKGVYGKCEQTALQVFRALKCSGIARVDLLIDSKTNIVYFNEINPLPGSLYTHNWFYAGLSSRDLVQALIDFALQKHKTETSQITTFKSSFLTK